MRLRDSLTNHLRSPAIWLAAAVTVGAVLRFTWNSDMEFKADEHQMFELSQHIGREEPWPVLGIPSGVGLRNPGMSVWVFVALARVFHASTPLQLDRAVVTLNVLAFVALLLFICWAVPPPEREAWFWAAALAAFSPMSLILQRKIWAQSVLPLFCVLFLVGWWRRDRRWGAVVWGAVGAALGQIHMSGFFFAAGMFLWTAAFSAQRFGRKPIRWAAWAVGSALGFAPAIPWFRYLLTRTAHGPGWNPMLAMNLQFLRNVYVDAFGLGLDYSLGGDTPAFLHASPFASTAIHPVLYLHAACMALSLILTAWVIRAGWRGRATLRDLVSRIGHSSETAFAIAGALAGFGLLITLSGVPIYRHYLIVTFAFEWLLVAHLALRHARWPRWLLGSLLVSQLGLSTSFLVYIHEHGGAPHGDYGFAYRVQHTRLPRTIDYRRDAATEARHLRLPPPGAPPTRRAPTSAPPQASAR